MKASPSSTPWPFLITLGTTLLVPLVGLVIAIFWHEPAMFPGAFLSLTFYGALAYFAYLGKEWARYMLITFMFLTGIVGLVFTFIQLGGRGAHLNFNPWMGIIPVFYGALTAGLIYGRRPLAR